MDAIPKVSDPERYEIVEFSHSDFVQITSNAYFDVAMQYPLMGMKNAEPLCYVRKEVYEMLLNAAGQLPEGFRFRIWDAWRPFALQDELYKVYSRDIIHQFELEKCTENQKGLVIRKFVSEPLEDRTVPPVHTTGGAVDLTIIDETGTASWKWPSWIPHKTREYRLIMKVRPCRSRCSPFWIKERTPPMRIHIPRISVFTGSC